MVQFHDFEAFLRMGNFGVYVWPAFLIVFVLLLSNIFFIRLQFRRVLKKLRKHNKRIA